MSQGSYTGRRSKDLVESTRITWFARKSVQEQLGRIGVYAVLTVGAVFVALPFFWMISTALKQPGTEFVYPPEWIPKPPIWRNFVDAWTILPFNQWAKNTYFITAFSILGHILSCSIVAFGFARLRFPGRNTLFLLVLSTMMLPYPVTMVPTFILFKSLGWLDTFRPLIVPNFLAVGAFYIFLLRQFLMTLPREMDDSARIDGCTTFGIYRYIALPLIKPALGIITIFSFMASWNDFLGPLIYLSSSEKFTLSLGLRYFQGQFDVEWTLLMAASLIVLAPCLVLFFIAQRFYIQGIVVTGIKG